MFLRKERKHMITALSTEMLLFEFDSEHTALFMQGLLSHSSLSVAHCVPSNPGTHVHRYLSSDNKESEFESSQVPPFAHEELAHSLSSVWHLSPE